ncbi:MAG: hypothetical protein K5912_04575 [Alphaproteobacteria bacterium]|nr:hypothetical protein [Alphaproteobacteria bacterium]
MKKISILPIVGVLLATGFDAMAASSLATSQNAPKGTMSRASSLHLGGHARSAGLIAPKAPVAKASIKNIAPSANNVQGRSASLPRTSVGRYIGSSREKSVSMAALPDPLLNRVSDLEQNKQDKLQASDYIVVEDDTHVDVNFPALSAALAADSQSDWEETDDTAASFIRNKPDLTAYDSHIADTDIHVTATDKDAWNAKQDAITSTNLLPASLVDGALTSSDLTDYDTHIADTDIHVTTTDKETWDNHVNNNDIHVSTVEKDAWNGKQNALSEEQLAAVNSGITGTKVTDYDSHLAATDLHVSSADKTAWNNHISDTDKHVTVADKTAWDAKQSALDNDQMAAVNSGITATKVSTYDTHIADTDIHVTTTDKSTWNAKQDAITSTNKLDAAAVGGLTSIDTTYTDLATAISDLASRVEAIENYYITAP